MNVERSEPPYELAERDMLESWLEYHRATLEMKCAGLSDTQLRERSVPPSSLSLLGLVRHMADVELNWFRRVLSVQDVPGLFWTGENPDGDFDDVDDAPVAEAFDAWRAECDNARAVAGRMALDMVWAEIALAAIAGMAFYGLVALAERVTTFWHPSYRT